MAKLAKMAFNTWLHSSKTGFCTAYHNLQHDIDTDLSDPSKLSNPLPLVSFPYMIDLPIRQPSTSVFNNQQPNCNPAKSFPAAPDTIKLPNDPQYAATESHHASSLTTKKSHGKQNGKWKSYKDGKLIKANKKRFSKVLTPRLSKSHAEELKEYVKARGGRLNLKTKKKRELAQELGLTTKQVNDWLYRKAHTPKNQASRSPSSEELVQPAPLLQKKSSAEFKSNDVERRGLTHDRQTTSSKHHAISQHSSTKALRSTKKTSTQALADSQRSTVVTSLEELSTVASLTNIRSSYSDWDTGFNTYTHPITAESRQTMGVTGGNHTAYRADSAIFSPAMSTTEIVNSKPNLPNNIWNGSWPSVIQDREQAEIRVSQIGYTECETQDNVLELCRLFENYPFQRDLTVPWACPLCGNHVNRQNCSPESCQMIGRGSVAPRQCRKAQANHLERSHQIDVYMAAVLIQQQSLASLDAYDSVYNVYQNPPTIRSDFAELVSTPYEQNASGNAESAEFASGPENTTKVESMGSLTAQWDDGDPGGVELDSSASQAGSDLECWSAFTSISSYPCPEGC